MKSRSQKTHNRGFSSAVANTDITAKSTQLAQLRLITPPSQLRLDQSARQSEQNQSVSQLQAQEKGRHQQLMQLSLRDKMTLAQQVMMEHDTAVANMPSKSNAATHVSPENRKETEEEKKHQATMSNAWKVSQGGRKPAEGEN